MRHYHKRHSSGTSLSGRGCEKTRIKTMKTQFGHRANFEVVKERRNKLGQKVRLVKSPNPLVENWYSIYVLIDRRYMRDSYWNYQTSGSLENMSRIFENMVRK